MSFAEAVKKFDADDMECIIKASHFAGMMEAKKEITVYEWEDLIPFLMEYVRQYLEENEDCFDFFDELEKRLLVKFTNPDGSLPEGWRTIYAIRIDDETADDGTYDIMVYEELFDDEGKCENSDRDDNLSVGHIKSLKRAEEMVEEIISGNPHLMFKRLPMLKCK